MCMFGKMQDAILSLEKSIYCNPSSCTHTGDKVCKNQRNFNYFRKLSVENAKKYFSRRLIDSLLSSFQKIQKRLIQSKLTYV